MKTVLRSNFSSTQSKCEICRKILSAQSHKNIVKNRNNTNFWGLDIPEKILCGDCLGLKKNEMPIRKQYLWNKYETRGYWLKEHD